MPAKLDLTGRKNDCTTTLGTAQTYRTAAGEAQKALEKAQKPMPYADRASDQASAAGGIFAEVDKMQDAVIAAGMDPSVVFAGLLSYGDNLLQSAKDWNLQASVVAGS